MEKQFNLTIQERLTSVRLFDEFKGSLVTLKGLLDDVKNLSVSQEEFDKAGLVKNKNQDGTESWNWKDEGSEKEINLSKESVDYLLEKIKAKSDAGELTFLDKGMISLEEKLK